MKTTKKIMAGLFFVCSVGIAVFMPVITKAEDRNSVYNDYFVSEQVRADVIVTKFRWYEGRLQYRHWNETRGYWVDPYWIDC